MHRGYYKAWRKITDSVTWSRGLEYRGLMHSILVRANRRSQPFRGVTVPRGALAVVLSSWAEELGLARQRLQRMLRVMAGEPDRFITLRNVGNRFTIITVTNWALYQSEDEPCRATGDRTVDTSVDTSGDTSADATGDTTADATGDTSGGQPSGNHRATTGQQNKKEEKEKKEEKKTPPTPPRGDVYSAAFLAFWEVYPIKRHKKRAWRVWKRIKGVNAAVIIEALGAQIAADHWRGSDGKDYIPHPTTWLNGAGWEDEIRQRGREDDLPPELR